LGARKVINATTHMVAEVKGKRKDAGTKNPKVLGGGSEKGPVTEKKKNV